MMGGYRFLLLIVVALGVVLIYGYTHLTFSTSENARHQDRHYKVVGTFSRPTSDLRPTKSSRSSTTTTSNSRSNLFMPVAPKKPTEAATVTTPKTITTLINRTDEAGNQDVVFFNRVPKTGSEMLQHFGKLLSSVLAYHIYIDPQPIVNPALGGLDEKDFVRGFNKEVNDVGIYFRHIGFVNFTTQKSPRPIYVSIIRDPIERMVSWFYYTRWKNRPDDRHAKGICNKNSRWAAFCGMYESSRNDDLAKPDSFYNLTFDDCVMDSKKYKECNFVEGDGYLLDNPDYRSQMMFFCGNGIDCARFNSKSVLEKAKANVDQIYSVVGLLEDLESTFKALEGFVPKFFRDAKALFDENSSNLTITHTNKNPFKKPLKPEVRKILEEKFDKELEFYEFCKQRLAKQIRDLNKLERSPGFSSTSWPDQLANSSIILADDYVLL